MGNLDDVLYPVIFEDHDGTWTWSVESGKAYEDSHRIHARGDCCLSKREARNAATAALRKIQCQGSPDQAAASALPGSMRGWAIVAGDEITTIFASKAEAIRSASAVPGGRVRRVSCNLDWED